MARNAGKISQYPANIYAVTKQSVEIIRQLYRIIDRIIIVSNLNVSSMIQMSRSSANDFLEWLIYLPINNVDTQFQKAL